MLGKLLKYEIKATIRWFLPLYLALLIFKGINKLFFEIPIDSSASIHSIFSAISMIIYVTLLAGILVITFIVMIQRFYKNLLGDEGYLMFTLPCKSWMHIASKLLVAMLWTVSSSLVAILSIFILAYKENIIAAIGSELSRFFEMLEVVFGTNIYIFSLETIVIGLPGLASSILMVYAAIALGHLFSKHKLLASFGMYIALQTAVRLLLAVFALLLGEEFFMSMVQNSMPGPGTMQMILLISFLYSVALTAGCFVLTQFILKNKLNLE